MLNLNKNYFAPNFSVRQLSLNVYLKLTNTEGICFLAFVIKKYFLIEKY